MPYPVTTMHNPPHPGEVLRDGVFAETGETVTSFARRLGVSRVALSRVLNGQAAVSAEMALRFAAALGGTPESWLHMQATYDLWQTRRGQGKKIERISRVGDLGQENPFRSSDRMTTLTVSSKYQIVIPARMCESLGIRPGGKLHAIEYRGRIALIPHESLKAARGSLKGIDTSMSREPDRA